MGKLKITSFYCVHTGHWIKLKFCWIFTGLDEKRSKNGRRQASTSVDRRPGRKLQSG